MKVLLIGRTTGKSVKRLREEFEKRGHAFRAIPTQRMLVCVEDDELIYCDENGEDISDFDVYFFRGGVPKFEGEITALAKELKKRSKVIVEPIRAEAGMPMDKLIIPHNGNFSVPDYELILGPTVYRHRKPNFVFPLVVKSTRGSMGKTVRKVSDIQELDGAVAHFRFPIIVQAFVPIEYDIRIMVVGNTVLGAFRRYNTPGDFLTTRPGAGRREKIEVTPEMHSIALMAQRVQGIEMAGIDLIERDGRLQVLEINASPQFRIFEQVVGVNAGEAIVRLVEQKYEQQRNL